MIGEIPREVARICRFGCLQRNQLQTTNEAAYVLVPCWKKYFPCILHTEVAHLTHSLVWRKKETSRKTSIETHYRQRVQTIVKRDGLPLRGLRDNCKTFFALCTTLDWNCCLVQQCVAMWTVSWTVPEGTGLPLRRQSAKWNVVKLRFFLK